MWLGGHLASSDEPGAEKLSQEGLLAILLDKGIKRKTAETIRTETLARFDGLKSGRATLRIY